MALLFHLDDPLGPQAFFKRRRILHQQVVLPNGLFLPVMENGHGLSADEKDKAEHGSKHKGKEQKAAYEKEE
ncbi:MAG: hypothetical protein IPL49_05665 [Saprospirales bacterium]|nr:hypothetical protein [Saprospirales bacterium]